MVAGRSTQSCTGLRALDQDCERPRPGEVKVAPGPAGKDKSIHRFRTGGPGDMLSESPTQENRETGADITSAVVVGYSLLVSRNRSACLAFAIVCRSRREGVRRSNSCGSMTRLRVGHRRFDGVMPVLRLPTLPSPALVAYSRNVYRIHLGFALKYIRLAPVNGEPSQGGPTRRVPGTGPAANGKLSPAICLPMFDGSGRRRLRWRPVNEPNPLLDEIPFAYHGRHGHGGSASDRNKLGRLPS
jgi:hypothetical protein